MAQSRPTLKVAPRDRFGSRTSRRLRREGLLPGVVYRDGEQARPLQADAHLVALFLNEGHTLFDLEIEGSSKVPVVVKDQQRHPVRGELVHIDFHEVDLSVEIQADVPIELSGSEEAPGVREGGVLEHVTTEITVEALPEAVPDRLELDVSEMVIGDTLQLSALPTPEGVTIVSDNPDEVTVATLNPPRVEAEPEPELEQETALVGEEPETAEVGEDAGAAAEDSGGDGGDGDEG